MLGAWTRNAESEDRRWDRTEDCTARDRSNDPDAHLPGGWWILPGVALGILFWTYFFFAVIVPTLRGLFSF